jgi:hypothetical protein
MKQIAFTFLFLSLLTLTCKDKVEEVTTPNTKGCGDFEVSLVVDDTTLLTVGIYVTRVVFKKSFQTIEDLNASGKGAAYLTTTCSKEDQEIVWRNSCNDAYTNTSCNTALWFLWSGSVKFKVNQVFESYSGCDHDYKATVILENAVFKNQLDTTFVRTFDRIEMNNVRVGLCAG